MNRNDDPWRGMDVPAEKSEIAARRIPQSGDPTWGLYWALDAGRHYLLILQRNQAGRHSHRLPQLRGLSVEVAGTEDGMGERVVLRLTDMEQREIFQRFCEDIVDATRPAGSPDEAVARFLARTWRWHRLLRTGRDGRLTEEEQKGLIGELHVLERHILPQMDAGSAVDGWTGPLDAPKDFQFGMTAIEVKARSPQASQVRIASVDQLDPVGSSRLFLAVVDVAGAPDSAATAVTVTDAAGRLRDAIKADEGASATFEDRLAAAGFAWRDDYSDKRWIVGDEALYEVRRGFPRIVRSSASAGVEDVRYAISLPACEGFRASSTALAQSIRG